MDHKLIVDNLRQKRVFLEKSGARCIVMPCHISHSWHDDISHGCSVSFLNMAECVAKELSEAKMRPLEAGSPLRIGVLATSAILEAGFYQEKLENEVILFRLSSASSHDWHFCIIIGRQLPLKLYNWKTMSWYECLAIHYEIGGTQTWQISFGSLDFLLNQYPPSSWKLVAFQKGRRTSRLCWRPAAAIFLPIASFSHLLLDIFIWIDFFCWLPNLYNNKLLSGRLGVRRTVRS